MGWCGGGGGAGALAVVGPIGVGLSDVFCFGVRLYVLLGSCLCFVSILCPWRWCMDGIGVFRVGQASVCLGPHLDEGRGWRAVKPVWALQWNIFAGCSRVVLHMWVDCVVCILCLSDFASVHCCHLVT